MSDSSREEPTIPASSSAGEMGEIGIAQDLTPETAVAPAPAARLMTQPSPAQQAQSRPGNVEHLAVRRSMPPLDTDAPDVKQRLSELRTDMTTLVTNLRWGGASVEETVENIIPMLNVGSVQQWAQPLLSTILEIDRAGNLVPVWLKIIERDDSSDLPANANPADTMIGRARRFAILMLGNYKSPELAQVLGTLSTDANSSLYATQALVKQSTTPAIQALVGALKDAEGWAKVDVVEAITSLKQSRFDEILLASGLDRASGLESYIAVPLFRTIELERYIQNETSPRLAQQAMMVVSQVLQDSLSSTSAEAMPVIFERDLQPWATALFASVRKTPDWRGVVALHRLAQLLGRCWADISRGSVKNQAIIDRVMPCLPMMPDVERWMNGPGREVLLAALNGSDEDAFGPCARVLGDLREPRAIATLITRLDATRDVTDRQHALQLATICDTLSRLGDRRAVGSLLQLLGRLVNVPARTAQPKRRDNLPPGDADIPASIIYAAVVRACGQFGDRSTLDTVTRAASDFDPYVRTQSLEALRRLDPAGEDMRSRAVVRDALNDPRDTVVRLACQLVAQYRDIEAVSALRYLIGARPELTASATDALRLLGQPVG